MRTIQKEMLRIRNIRTCSFGNHMYSGAYIKGPMPPSYIHEVIWSNITFDDKLNTLFHILSALGITI